MYVLIDFLLNVLKSLFKVYFDAQIVQELARESILNSIAVSFIDFRYNKMLKVHLELKLVSHGIGHFSEEDFVPFNYL